jgi:hypothetical protein
MTKTTKPAKPEAKAEKTSEPVCEKRWRRWLRRSARLGTSYDEINPPAAALGADEPLVPVGDGHLGSVALGHRGRVGLGLVPAIETPHDQPHPRHCGVAQGHRRAAVCVHKLIIFESRRQPTTKRHQWSER